MSHIVDLYTKTNNGGAEHLNYSFKLLACTQQGKSMRVKGKRNMCFVRLQWRKNTLTMCKDGVLEFLEDEKGCRTNCIKGRKEIALAFINSLFCPQVCIN